MKKLDKERTAELRKHLDELYNSYSKSPFNQLMKERDKGIHPTTHDKEMTGYNPRYKINGKWVK